MPWGSGSQGFLYLLGLSRREGLASHPAGLPRRVTLGPRLHFLLWLGTNRMQCGWRGPVGRGEPMTKPGGPSPSQEWRWGGPHRPTGHFAWGFWNTWFLALPLFSVEHQTSHQELNMGEREHEAPPGVTKAPILQTPPPGPNPMSFDPYRKLRRGVLGGPFHSGATESGHVGVISLKCGR